MVYFLQIYCSHYGPKARPVAYGLLGDDVLIGRESADPLVDWFLPLNRALESLPIQNTLYLFHGQFETRILWPFLTKKARARLEEAVDLYDEIKKRTALAPLSSYKMASMAKDTDYLKDVIVGDGFSEFFRGACSEDVAVQIESNLRAMAAVHAYYEGLRRHLRRGELEIQGFTLRPFQIVGKSEGTVDRYVQYDDLLYTEEGGRFTFDGPATLLPYDDKRKALVLETDAPIEQSVEAPEGFLIFALEDTVYYDTIFSLIQWLRDKGQ